MSTHLHKLINSFLVSRSALGMIFLFHANPRRNTNVQTFTKGAWQPPQLPEAFCLNLSPTQEVWPTCGGGQRRPTARASDGEKKIYAPEIKRDRKLKTRNTVCSPLSCPAASPLPAGWDLLLWWGSQPGIWWDAGNITGVGLFSIGVWGLIGSL